MAHSGSLSWPEVAARLAAARDYWLCTTTPAARGPRLGRRDRPDAVPVRGAGNGQGRNPASDPRVLVHLGDAEDVLIVRGTAEDLGRPAEHPEALAALAAKYGPTDRQYLPDADPAFDVLYAVRPRSAMTWRLADYETSQRRWPALAGQPDATRTTTTPANAPRTTTAPSPRMRAPSNSQE